MGTLHRLDRAMTPVLQRLRRGIFSPPGMSRPEHLTSTGNFIEPLERRIIADMSLGMMDYCVFIDYRLSGQLFDVQSASYVPQSYQLWKQENSGSWQNLGDYISADYPGWDVINDEDVQGGQNYQYAFFTDDDNPGNDPNATPVDNASIGFLKINSAGAGANSLTISWQPGPSTDDFAVFGSNSFSEDLGSASSFSIAGLAPDTTFGYTVVDLTTGVTSNEFDITTGPSAPTLTATVSGSDVNIAWDPAGGSSTSINLFRGTTPDFTPDSTNLLASLMGQGSRFADTAPAAGTRAYYKAIGVNNNGLSSVPSGVVGVGTLAAPTNLQAKHNSASGDVQLSWTPAPGSVQTLIERSDDSGSSWTPVATVPVNSGNPTSTCTTTDNISGQSSAEYRATSEDGLSADGNYDDLTASGTATDPVPTTDIAPPDAVSNFQAASNSPRTVDLSWQNNAADQTEVDVQQSSDGTNYNTIATLAADAASYQATNLQPGQSYYFKVVASNNGLQSTDSPVQTIQAQAGQLTITPVSGLHGSRGQVVSGVLAHVSDTDPQDVPEDFSVTVNWGDNTTNQDAELVASPSGGFNVVGSHNYLNNSSSFTPVITVAGIDGSSAGSNGPSVPVNTPSVGLSPVIFHPFEGEIFAGPVATFTDSNPLAVASDFTAFINWDSPGRAGIINPTVVGGNGSFRVIGSYIYDSNEVAHVTVTLQGADVGNTPGIAEYINVTPSIIGFVPVIPQDYEGTIHNGVVARMTDSDIHAADVYRIPEITWNNGVIDTNPSVAIQEIVPGVYNVKLVSPPLHWPLAMGSFQVVSGLHIVSSLAMIMAKPAPASGDWAATLHASGNPVDGYTLPQQELTGFSSADPDHNVNDFTAVIHWGDGSTSDGDIAEASAGSNLYNISGSHAFSKVINPPAGYFFTAGPFWVAVYEHGQEVGAIQGDGIEEDNDGQGGEAAIQFANSTDGIAPKLNYGQNPPFGSGSGGTTGGGDGGGDNGGDGGGGGGGGDNGGGDNGGDGGGGDNSGGITIWPEPLNVSMGQPVGDLAVIAQFTAPAAEANDSFSAVASYLDADGNEQTLPVYVDGNNVEILSDVAINTAGDYDVDLTVSDDATGDSASAETELVVADADLTGQNVPALKKQAGQPFTVKVAGVSSSDNEMEDSELEATIDWGDGTSGDGTVVDGAYPGQFNVVGTHTYASPNPAGTPYQVQTTIDEVSNPNNEAYAVTTIDTSVPTVGVVENGTAQESDGGNSTETFTFTRSGDTTNSLEVPLDITGTAVEGTNYTLDADGQVADSEVNFDAGQSSVTATVVPIDDHTPAGPRR